MDRLAALLERRRWVVLAVILLVGGSWYIGKLDDYLPERIRSTTVLGENAPANKKDDKPAEKAPEKK